MVTPMQRTAPPIRSAPIEYVRKTVGTGYLSTLPVFLDLHESGAVADPAPNDVADNHEHCAEQEWDAPALDHPAARPSVDDERWPVKGSDVGIGNAPRSSPCRRSGPSARLGGSFA